MILNIVSVSGIYFLPLTFLSLISGIFEILEKSLRISERTEEYKFVYKFYQQMLNNYRSNKINENEINTRESELEQNLIFFPLEQYLKEAGLNGYGVINQAS